MRSQVVSFLVLFALAFVLFAATSTASISFGSKTEAPASVPFFLWSPKSNVFNGPKHLFKTITHGGIRSILDKICHIESTETAPIELVNEKTPEVLVVFLENKLSTRQFSTLKANTFAHLKKAISSAKSSITIPYGYVNAVVPVSSWLERFIAKLIEKYPAASIYLSRFTNSQMLEEASENSQVVVTTQETLISQLEESSVFDNQTPDLVICTLDATTIEQHDAFISQVSGLINAKTGGNAVYMFTGDVPAANQAIRAHTMEEIDSIHLFAKKNLRDSQDGNLTPYNIGMFSSYWPIQMFEVLMVSILLIFTLFVGSYCLFSSQSPQRFEAVKRVRNNEMM